MQLDDLAYNDIRLEDEDGEDVEDEEIGAPDEDTEVGDDEEEL